MIYKDFYYKLSIFEVKQMNVRCYLAAKAIGFQLMNETLKQQFIFKMGILYKIIQRCLMISCTILLFFGLYFTVNKHTSFLNKASQVSNTQSIPIKLYDYQKSLDIIESIKRDIWSEWDVSNYPLFLTLTHIPSDSWELQKYKFIRLVLENVSNSLHKNKSEFVVGFSGSSVTA